MSAEPCRNEKVLAVIEAAADDVSDYRAATGSFGGQTFAACWMPLFEQRRAIIRYEDGDIGSIPFNDMKPVQNI
jgi:hypothetical protein